MLVVPPTPFSLGQIVSNHFNYYYYCAYDIILSFVCVCVFAVVSLRGSATHRTKSTLSPIILLYRYIMHRGIITTTYLHDDNIALPSTKKVIYYDLFFVFLTYKIYIITLCTLLILCRKQINQTKPAPSREYYLIPSSTTTHTCRYLLTPYPRRQKIIILEITINTYTSCVCVKRHIIIMQDKSITPVYYMCVCVCAIATV